MTGPASDRFSGPGQPSVALFRRLRAWSLSSWRHGERVGVARGVLARLAAMATEFDGSARPPVPDAGVLALPDQLEVLAVDALLAGVPLAEILDVLADLAAGLGVATN